MAYAKGLVELDNKVDFILLSRQRWEKDYFEIDKISFHNCFTEEKNLIIPKIKNALSLYRSLRKVRDTLKLLHTQNPDMILILLDVSSFTLTPIINTAKISGIKIYHERTEYPFVVSSKSMIGRLNLYLYLNYVISRFDGIYVINKALVSYFEKLTENKVPIKIINMIVDPDRFKCNGDFKKDQDIHWITYCGGLDGDKDGVPILIESFSMISAQFPNFNLKLIGSLQNEKTRKNLEAKVKELNLENRVFFTGSLKREEIPMQLCDSSILALARPSNKQAEGGFPTKLGEYLATGNPVVVTNVGEIGDFLKDRQNAFLAKPDSVEAFAFKLKEAILSETSAKIGTAGKKLVQNEFNYLTQAKELEKFLLL
jgi:glycosyltransferase involved in cell wall biosynthesis